ncbi:MAG TPA: hypothetical protein VJB41_02975 [Patescibacteria group bacterium]|nr:hypothetical protein [Patescibacteria group bacterium]
MTEEIRRREESISTLSFEQFIAVDAILGMKKYNNFMARLLTENRSLAIWDTEGKANATNEFFYRLKEERSELIDPLMEKIAEYKKIPREKLKEERAMSLLNEIEPDLFEVYKILKGYGADDHEDLSFSPQ